MHDADETKTQVLANDANLKNIFLLRPPAFQMDVLKKLYFERCIRTSNKQICLLYTGESLDSFGRFTCQSSMTDTHIYVSLFYHVPIWQIFRWKDDKMSGCNRSTHYSVALTKPKTISSKNEN
jgi:hypothetical protein